jgi:hypothetical protein
LTAIARVLRSTEDSVENALLGERVRQVFAVAATACV